MCDPGGKLHQVCSVEKAQSQLSCSSVMVNETLSICKGAMECKKEKNSVIRGSLVLSGRLILVVVVINKIMSVTKSEVRFTAASRGVADLPTGIIYNQCLNEWKTQKDWWCQLKGQNTKLRGAEVEQHFESISFFVETISQH
uniref:Uncharacterized protein n=1 Tax=Setaria digitata TaxID=48799 RepID=A0A915PKC1_9BILA